TKRGPSLLVQNESEVTFRRVRKSEVLSTSNAKVWRSSGLTRPFPDATPCLRRQASWPTALRRCNERRTPATPAIPLKPSSIIAQVAGSGVANGFTEDRESVNRTSANHAVGVALPVKDESRISIGAPASALVAV